MTKAGAVVSSAPLQVARSKLRRKCVVRSGKCQTQEVFKLYIKFEADNLHYL